MQRLTCRAAGSWTGGFGAAREGSLTSVSSLEWSLLLGWVSADPVGSIVPLNDYSPNAKVTGTVRNSAGHEVSRVCDLET